MSFDCLYGELPREKEMPVCPVCNSECNEVYVDGNNNIVWCEVCIEWETSIVIYNTSIKKVSALDYFRED